MGWLNLDKLQIKIGKILSLFSIIIFVTKIISSIINNNLNTLLTIDKISYLLYALLFLISTYWINTFTKIIQILIIFIESMFSLSPGMSSSFFGLSMIIIDILLCYRYKLFNTHKYIKIVCSIVSFYLILLFIPLHHCTNNFLYAFQWTMFIIIFLSIIWFIFKDYIEKIEEEEKIVYTKLIKIIEEAMEVAKDAIKKLDEIKEEQNER